MKKTILYQILPFLFVILVTESCEEPTPTYEVRLDEYPQPVMEVEQNIEDTINIMVEDAFVFNLEVKAEAGLVSLNLNDKVVHTFPYGQLKDEVEYSFVMPDVEDTTLVFTLVDEAGQTISTNEIIAKAEGRLDPYFLINNLNGPFVEFVGEPIPNQPGGQFAAVIGAQGGLEVEQFSLRALWLLDDAAFYDVFTLNIEGPEGDKALKIDKHSGFTNVIANMGNPIPEVFINENDAGKRAYQFEIYYDNSANPDAPGDLPFALNFDLYMANFAKYKNDKAGIYNTYTGTIPSANQWHQVTLEVKDAGGRRTGDVETNEIDAFSLKLSPGFDTGDNPYYIRNFAVVKVN